MQPEKSPFRIRVNSQDEVIARANNLPVGRVAFETTARLDPRDTIQYRGRARNYCEEASRKRRELAANVSWKRSRGSVRFGLGPLSKLVGASVLVRSVAFSRFQEA
jgi:hypothetical protein